MVPPSLTYYYHRVYRAGGLGGAGFFPCTDFHGNAYEASTGKEGGEGEEEGEEEEGKGEEEEGKGEEEEDFFSFFSFLSSIGTALVFFSCHEIPSFFSYARAR
jgi:hypothetical protein